jgi:2'-5' RNA ligase
MTLETDEDRQRAIECLNEVKNSVSEPVKIRFTGLDTFQRNPRGVSVVFGKVLSADFSMFADGVSQKFVEKSM